MVEEWKKPRRALVVLGAAVLACCLFAALIASPGAPSAGTASAARDFDSRIAPVLESLHWEYRGVDGPATWGKNYLTCNEGLTQSPVDIESEVNVQ